MVRDRGAPVALLLAACLACQLFLGVSAYFTAPRERREAIATAPPTVTALAATEKFTAVSECHLHHQTEAWCMFGSSEYQVIVPPTLTSDLPPAFTECHPHGDTAYCVAPDGSDVEIVGYEVQSDDAEGADPHGEDGHDQPAEEGQNCHFHAGVEHCVGPSSEESTAASCEKRDRDYNIGLRVGLLFVMLAAGLVGSVSPIFLAMALPPKFGAVFSIVKQFGTGVIISTAFVHLYTHATLMLTNDCLGELKYESTTSAIVMAGLFVSFLIEYISHRVARHFWGSSDNDAMSVLILEAGIIFHSILIGITVVVAGDGYFVTLFVVIIFHQMFEGIALGTRIAAMGGPTRSGSPGDKPHSHGLGGHASAGATPNGAANPGWKTPSLLAKLLMAVAFAITTPVGMAIGIGVLDTFNGNDPTTLWALGTLDALSAGILVWVGVVEMWAGDWIFGGEMTHSSPLVTALALFGLVAGMALMSFLGKWA
ncbi:hypothetical protein DL766_006817 [Monosporascus sp. MC13-8B]|uniref:Uncharacterized protein n=1 Tax=Monosporascus cannonballus TaxID=155416 RepID=A0ABY0H394_9PEZI|nr:hypothetical protein DL762_006169 [Monosporascus cannonballus]RYO90976.1 hypothetical protein DL763_005147 [Monosporascus cannonballus]RYP26144.1 hypothetical protein DL766_006817 [Monosporascus sp. MC13-8B]